MRNANSGTQHHVDRRASQCIAVVYAALLAAYLIAIEFGRPARAPGPGNIINGTDSQLYLYAARHWPWDATAARVAPLYSVFINLGFRNLQVIVALQTIVTALVWWWLATSVRKLISARWLGWVGFVAVLAFSLAPEVLLWNAAISSEHLSIVLMIATLAAALTAIRVRTPRAWKGVGVCIALSVLGRDTNVIAASAAVVIALVVFVQSLRSSEGQRRNAAVVVVALCVSTAVLSTALSNQGDPPRWFYPLQENIAMRVIPRAYFTQWFANHGMPQASELHAVGGDKYFAHYLQLEHGSEFAPFRTWLRNDGQRVYAQFIATHMPWAMATFVRERGYVFNPSVNFYTTIARAKPGAIYGLIGATVFWRLPGLLMVWAALLLAIAVVIVLNKRPTTRVAERDAVRLLAFAAAVSIATGLAHAFVADAGDIFEIGRHAFTAALQIRLTLFIATILFGDIVWLRFSRRTQELRTVPAPNTPPAISDSQH